MKFCPKQNYSYIGSVFFEEEEDYDDLGDFIEEDSEDEEPGFIARRNVKTGVSASTSQAPPQRNTSMNQSHLSHRSVTGTRNLTSDATAGPSGSDSSVPGAGGSEMDLDSILDGLNSTTNSVSFSSPFLDGYAQYTGIDQSMFQENSPHGLTRSLFSVLNDDSLDNIDDDLHQFHQNAPDKPPTLSDSVKAESTTTTTTTTPTKASAKSMASPASTTSTAAVVPGTVAAVPRTPGATPGNTPAPLSLTALPVLQQRLTDTLDAPVAFAQPLDTPSPSDRRKRGATDSGTKLEFETILDRKNVAVDTCLFYFLDAYEDAHQHPGDLFLFGKVLANEAAVLTALRHNARVDALELERAVREQKAKSESTSDDMDEDLLTHAPIPAKVQVPVPQFLNACVKVTNNVRSMYFVPREFHAINGHRLSLQREQAPEVIREVHQVLKEKVFPPGQEARIMAKPVLRYYAFDETKGLKRLTHHSSEAKDPEKAEPNVLKVLYSSRFPPPPAGLMGATFCHVFGANTSNLEHFFLKRRIQGPSWLRLTGVENQTHRESYCAVELLVRDPKGVNPFGGYHEKVTKGGVKAKSGEVLSYGQTPALARYMLLPADKRTVLGEPVLPLPTPNVTAVSLSIKTEIVTKAENSKRITHEIVALALTIHENVRLDQPTGENRAHTRAVAIVRPGVGATALPPEFVLLANKNPWVLRQQSERGLLSTFLTHLERIDPDILVGHNISGWDLDILLHRLAANHVHDWARLGRLERRRLPRRVTGVGREQYAGVLTAGRIVCDTYLTSKEFLREPQYSLTALAASQLNLQREEIDASGVSKMIRDGHGALQLLQHTVDDSWIALKLALKIQVIPLTKQLTNIAGNLWSRSIRGSKAERIEYLLLKEFHRLKYIKPDKASLFGNSGNAAGAGNDGQDDVLMRVPGDGDDDEDGEGGRAGGRGRSNAGAKKSASSAGTVVGSAARFAQKRGKPTYSGGLVLEPKVGLYDSFVIVLDFNSLYPSLIQEYNLCYTTVAPPPPVVEEEQSEESFALIDVPSTMPLGVLPQVIKRLVDERRLYRDKMNRETNAALRATLNIRQSALKILANSMYGCLGFVGSRFCANYIAAQVTRRGRDTLKNTQEIAEGMGLCVVYGDTDSIMIHKASEDIRDVKKVGMELKRQVNRRYKCLTIDIDAVFAKMLLLRKKKYAALKVHEGPNNVLSLAREVKGLDLVRRDWCPLSKKLGDVVLDILFHPKIDPETAPSMVLDELKKASQKVRDGQIPIEDFVITKALNRHPKDYADHKGQPHLAVALAQLEQGKVVNVGDHIEYVICNQPYSEMKEFLMPKTNVANASRTITSPASPSAVKTELGSPQSPIAAALATDPATPTPKTPHTPGASRTGVTASIDQRAYHPNDVRRSGGLITIDYEWYLQQQILPPIARICEPLEALPQDQIADMLGLETQRYADWNNMQNFWTKNTTSGLRYAQDDSKRFETTDKFLVQCIVCGHKCPFPGPVVRDPSLAESAAARALEDKTLPQPLLETKSGLFCPEPGCPGVFGSALAPRVELSRMPRGFDMVQYAQAQLANALTLHLRKRLKQAQKWTYRCSENCSKEITSVFRQNFTGKCPSPNCTGTLERSESASSLHEDILYLDAIFDLKRAVKRYVEKNSEQESNPLWQRFDSLRELPDKMPDQFPKEHIQMYDALKSLVQTILNDSAYHFINVRYITEYLKA